VGIDEVQKKKSKTNACYPTLGISPRKTRKSKPIEAKKSSKKSK
jgi:hypothetical protein